MIAWIAGNPTVAPIILGAAVNLILGIVELWRRGQRG